MKVAYVYSTNNASTFELATMILPQLEKGMHGAEVIGMMFFDDNLYCCARRIPLVSAFRRSPATEAFC